MGGYALLICRSQTEAIGLRRKFGAVGCTGRGRAPAASRTNRILRMGGARERAAGGLGCASAAAAWCAAVPRAAGGLI